MSSFWAQWLWPSRERVRFTSHPESSALAPGFHPHPAFLYHDNAVTAAVVENSRLRDGQQAPETTLSPSTGDLQQRIVQKPERSWSANLPLVWRDTKSRSTPRGRQRQASGPSSTSSKNRILAGALSPRDFVKLRLIGKGDVGRVYLVRNVHTNSLYAMKVVRKKDLIERDKVKRALTEQKLLCALHHPFIVKLYHSFQNVTHLFLCLEYCAGGEFFRTLQKQPGRRLPESSARFYAAEVLCALEYLHLQGFIYRDLKPENILIHESGHIMLAGISESRHFSLSKPGLLLFQNWVDFDLSKTSEQVSDPTVIRTQANMFRMYGTEGESMEGQVDTEAVLSHFRSNSFVGTEEYIAPEMLHEQGHTSSVDWWTLGIFIYELLYGHTPFKGKTRHATFRNVLSKPVTFPSEPTDISQQVQTLIRRLLAKQPGHRLGARFGAAEIKAQAWFRSVQWALLRNQEPPLRPVIAHPADTSNFRSYERELAADGRISAQSSADGIPWDTEDLHETIPLESDDEVMEGLFRDFSSVMVVHEE